MIFARTVLNSKFRLFNFANTYLTVYYGPPLEGHSYGRETTPQSRQRSATAKARETHSVLTLPYTLLLDDVRLVSKYKTPLAVPYLLGTGGSRTYVLADTRTHGTHTVAALFRSSRANPAIL